MSQIPTQRLAIAVADELSKLPPSAIVRALLALDEKALIDLGNAAHAQWKAQRCGHPVGTAS